MYTKLVERSLKNEKDDIKGKDLEWKEKKSLRGKPVIIMCKYIANFERMDRKVKERMEEKRGRKGQKPNCKLAKDHDKYVL